MKKKLFLLTALLLLISSLRSQDLSGYWQGVLYQPGGPFTTYFPYTMQLNQTGTVVSGISRIEVENSPYFAVHTLAGTVANKIFNFQQKKITSQSPPPGGYWCVYSGTLTYDSSKDKMSGPWSGGGCSPGTIELWHLKLLSDTVFCKGESVELSVTGQNVKWYSDANLTTVVDTGNTFSPLIDSTTTYYITQTHFNAESPAVPIKITVLDTVSPAISITSDHSGVIAPGTSVTFTAVAVNGGDVPMFAWKKNGIDVGTNSNTFTDNNWITGTLISCELTSNAPCAAPVTVSSNIISVIVPIHLLSFTANTVSNKIYCNWQTASEENASYFIIEKSGDGRVFTALTRISAAGNSRILHTYNYPDENPLIGKSYYRLKMVNDDGKFTYSSIVAVTYITRNMIDISPNPVADKLNVQIESRIFGKANIQVRDINGRLLFKMSSDINVGSNIISLPVQSFGRGTYILKVIQGNDVQVIKWLKE